MKFHAHNWRNIPARYGVYIRELFAAGKQLTAAHAYQAVEDRFFFNLAVPIHWPGEHRMKNRISEERLKYVGNSQKRTRMRAKYAGAINDMTLACPIIHQEHAVVAFSTRFKNKNGNLPEDWPGENKIKAKLRLS